MFEHRPFGAFLKLSVCGASHAKAIGFRLENFPRGMPVDRCRLHEFMERRAPGRDRLSTARREADEVELLEGVRNGVTTGSAIVGRIANADCRPGDYGADRTIPRPGHADFGQWVEFGRIPTGGGANSGRLTAALCAAGALCRQYLVRRGVTVSAAVYAIGSSTVDCENEISEARADGDSVGGMVECRVDGLRPGLGGALFAGIECELSAALFAIPGANGVEFGNGFAAAMLRGSENDDPFVIADGEVRTDGNNQGGLLGGRTSGMPLVLRVAMKPTPTVYKRLRSVDLATMRPAVCEMKGRHDPCIVRRAVPVVEALTAFVLADRLLATEAETPRICQTLTAIGDADGDVFAHALFTDMVEVRIDLLKSSLGDLMLGAGFRKLLDSKLPTVFTYRRKRDGGAFEGDEAVRERFFRELLLSGAIDGGEYYLDFEDDFRVPELDELARNRSVRIVRSAHCFDGKPGNVVELCRRMVAGTDEIAKVAFMPQDAGDVADLFAEMRDFTEVEHVVCAMGPLGAATRTLAVRTHSKWTYASPGGLEHLGHLSPFELVRNYRFRTHTRDWALYGVTGWPLGVTRSPELHNAAFLAEDADAVMAAFPCETAEAAVKTIRALGLRGMAVTIPHKQSIMPLLDEVSDEAKAIGAVNTVVARDGRLIGCNTDADGFGEAVAAFAGRDRLDGLRAAVLGAGGASKAVTFALKRLGAEVEVFHRRTPAPGFGLIVNATPVDPIPDYAFDGSELVYDLVYAPAETPLMARARAAGCRVENGLSMLANQARRQRELWRV